MRSAGLAPELVRPVVASDWRDQRERRAQPAACLLKNGFQPLGPTPDWEGTVY